MYVNSVGGVALTRMSLSCASRYLKIVFDSAFLFIRYKLELAFLILIFIPTSGNRCCATLQISLMIRMYSYTSFLWLIQANWAINPLFVATVTVESHCNWLSKYQKTFVRCEAAASLSYVNIVSKNDRLLYRSLASVTDVSFRVLLNWLKRKCKNLFVTEVKSLSPIAVPSAVDSLPRI